MCMCILLKMVKYVRVFTILKSSALPSTIVTPVTFELQSKYFCVTKYGCVFYIEVYININFRC